MIMRQRLLRTTSAAALVRALQVSATLPLALALLVSEPATAGTISTNAAAVSLLSGFSSLPQSAFSANLAATIAINNNASAAQRSQAYSDANNLDPNPTAYVSSGQTQSGIAQLSDGLGTVASSVLSNMVNNYSASAANTSVYNVFRQAYTLSGADSSNDKTYFGNLKVYDTAYNYTTSVNGYQTTSNGDPRPFLISTSIQLYTAPGTSAAYGLPGSTYATAATSPSFPSGHTTGGWTYALLEAIMLPERYQQEITRGSEYGYSRVVLGVHYALDAIAGRILALKDVASMLNNTSGYVDGTVGGVAIPADYASAFASATSTYRSALQQACGSLTIASCVTGNSGDRFANSATNRANYTYQLTYGLSPVGNTTLAPVVPQGAEVLLATRFPYLSAEQRREVLYTTELPSGYALDDGSGWARLDLYSAAAGYGALRSDVTVTLDKSLGGFNAADTWSNSITGSGRLIKNGSGSLTLSGTNSFGGIQVNAGTLALTGSNTFSGASQIGSNGTLVVAIDGASAGSGAGSYARITGTGSASFTAGGTLQPVMGAELASTSGYKNPAVGTQYTIVSTAAANGVSGRFSNLVLSSTTQASLLADTTLTVSYAANAVVLSVTPTSYSRASIATTGTQASVAGALDRIRSNTGYGATADADTSSLLGVVGSLGSAQLSGGLTQLSGVGVLNHSGSSLAVSQAVNQVLGSRLAQLHGGSASLADRASQGMFGFALNGAGGGVDQVNAGSTGIAGGDDGLAGGGALSGLTTWARGLGVFSRNYGDGNAPGFNSRVGGAVVGADYQLTEQVLLGGSFGYARSRVTGSEGTGRTEGNSYQVAGYGSWTPGAFFVDGSIGYTFSDFESRRNLSLGSFSGTAKGNTTGGDLGLALRAGKRFDLAGFAVEPDAGFAYDRITTDGFTESGAGAFNLTVGKNTVNSLRSSVGGRISRSLKTNEGITVEPELRAHWQHEILDENASTTSSLVGVPFSVQNAKPGRDAAVVGASLAGVLSDQVKIFAAYDATVRANQTDHALTGGIRIKW